MVDESNIEINGEDSTDNVAETEEFDVIYSCLRCNTKVRPPIVKTVKAT